MNDSLTNLKLTKPIIPCSTNMQCQFRASIESHQQADIHQAAVPPLESQSSPDIAPGPFGDEFLAGSGEFRGSVFESFVDGFVSEDGAADFESFVEELFVEVGKVGIGAHPGQWVVDWTFQVEDKKTRERSKLRELQQLQELNVQSEGGVRVKPLPHIAECYNGVEVCIKRRITSIVLVNIADGEIAKAE